jgi:hypothetical protein
MRTRQVAGTKAKHAPYPSELGDLLIGGLPQSNEALKHVFARRDGMVMFGAVLENESPILNIHPPGTVPAVARKKAVDIPVWIYERRNRRT